MKRFFALLLIAGLILAVILFFSNPQLLDGIWLWLIGFAGSIVGLFVNIFDQLKGVFNKKDTVAVAKVKAQAINLENEKSKLEIDKAKLELEKIKHKLSENETILKEESPFEGTTIRIVRFTHDADTTLGLMYINGKFSSCTLEDTYRPKKIKHQTRIPEGEYEIDFLNVITPMTEKYRKHNYLKGIFTFHIEIKNVPNYSNVYIHVGNNHEHTSGCILVADGIGSTSINKTITQSRKAYLKFYNHISSLLKNGEKVRIVIHDEDWLKKIKL